MTTGKVPFRKTRLFSLLVFLLVVVNLFLIGNYCLDLSNIRQAKSVRDVTLYDTSTESYQNKSNVNINTKGYFVDKTTGLKFSTTIQDKLYREFEEGKNKPIELQKELSLDVIESTRTGKLFTILGGFLWLVAVVISGSFFVSHINRK